jgi:hypothetical protein
MATLFDVDATDIEEAASGRPTTEVEDEASNHVFADVALENPLPFLTPLELLHAAVPPPGTAAPTATVLDATEIAWPVVGVVRLLS